MHTEQENIFIRSKVNKRLTSKMFKAMITNSSRKMDKGNEQEVHRKTKKANKHLMKCSDLIVIREIKRKTAMR